jgi:hypothetical protein
MTTYADKIFLVQQRERRFSDEEMRQAANAAKTARLREMRLEKEAAEREAAAKAKSAKRPR